MDKFEKEFIFRLREVQNSNNLEERIDNLFNLLIFLGSAKKYEEVINQGEELYELCRKHNYLQKASQILYYMAFSYLQLEHYDTALETYFKIILEYQDYYTEVQISSVYNEIGRCYNMIKDYEKAIEFYKKSLELDPENITRYSNLSSAYLNNKDYKKARKFLSITTEKAANSNDKNTQVFNYGNLGYYYFELREYEKALYFYKNARDGFEKLGKIRYSLKSQIDMGVTEYKLGNYENAVRLLESSIQLAKEHKEEVLESHCYKNLSKIYEEMGEYKKSLENMKNYQELNEKYLNENIYKKMSVINLKYEKFKQKYHTETLLGKASQIATVGMMASGILHEIKQPLNTIKISSDNILFNEENYPGTFQDKFLKDIDNISSGINQIQEIMEQIRSFWENIDSTVYRDKSASLNKTVTGITEMMNRQIISSGIELYQNLFHKEIEVECPKTQLEQIIINLVNNSIQALNSVHRQKIIEITTGIVSDRQGYLKICDNGEGIDPEIEDKIFDPLFSTRTPHNGSGMGLGLAIVEDILKKIGAVIEIKREKEQGICFMVTFIRRSNNEDTIN